MASVTKLETGRWLARVRRKGYPPQSKTFSTKALAQAWAKQIEGDTEKLTAGVMPKGTAWTVGRLVQQYEDEVGKSKPFGRNKADVLNRIKGILQDVQLAELTPERVVRFIRDDRKVAGVTAGIDLVYLKSVLKTGRALFKLPIQPAVVDDAREMLHHMGLLDRGEERDRRPTADELEAVRHWLGTHSETLTVDHVDFILASCFRPPSEVTGLRWADLNRADRTIVIRDRKDPKRKIGNNQTVPLLGDCMAIIDRQPRVDESPFIFPVNGKSWSSLFPRACRSAGIQNLRLYDLRHEAISRLVESNKYSIPEICLVTGHKDWKMLARYTQIRAKDLHDREDKNHRAKSTVRSADDGGEDDAEG